MARKRSKISFDSSAKKSGKNSKPNHSRRAQSALSDSRNHNQAKTHESYLNHSQSQRGVDISHLVIKSLIDFEQNKMKDAFLKK